MAENLSIENLRSQLTSLRDEASQFFTEVGVADDIRRAPVRKISKDANGEDVTFESYEPGKEFHRVACRLSREENIASASLIRKLKRLMVGVAALVKGAELLGEADIRDLGDLTKEMSAALKFRRYQHWGIHIHHNEGDFIGADPPGQSEDETVSVKEAHVTFVNSHKRVMEMTDLVSDAERGIASLALQGSSNYRPDTAFIMMQIDKQKPELQDVLDAVREVFAKFGIKARRSDEFQHDDGITSRVLEEITTSEFLFADLTGERPNVYYEVGYAHAIKKRVILYQRKGTRVHFDLGHRNCPEYENLKELRHLLHLRLLEMTGKQIPEA